ncbi:MAG: hypothetical protein LBC63_05620 [Holophagales bacterium]|jgi:hypothetical protein|nr:hypothetical protein [Holophagales bacterium]
MKSALACLMLAQSFLIGQPADVRPARQGAAGRLLQNGNDSYSSESIVEHYRQTLKESQRGMFVLLDSDNGSLLPAFRKLLQAEGLAELKLGIRHIRLGVERIELKDYLVGKYSWRPGPRWAFIDPNEKCLAQGTVIPDAKALVDQLDRMGVQSPVKRIRDYVRRYPENIDGRLALLKMLWSIAEERTEGELGQNNLAWGQDYGRQQFASGNWRTIRINEMLRVMNADEELLLLSPEKDLKIWAWWADEFDRLMASEQWLESDFAFSYSDDFLDRHSTIVKDIYKKRIGLVEDALRKWPGSDRIWGIWLHMALVLGDRPAKALMNTLAPMPDTTPGTWPPFEAKMVLVQQARRSGDWRSVRDLLLDSFTQFSQTISNIRRRINARDMYDQEGQMFLGSQLFRAQWQQLMEPLIESMLRLGDVGGADGIVTQLKEYAGPGVISDMAAAVALRCDMPQLAERWKND